MTIAVTDGVGLCSQRQRGHEQADPQGMLPQPAGQKAFLRAPRRALHVVRFGRLCCERHPRQAVGHKVHPQDVNGEQRQRQPQKGRQKQCPDLPGIG